MNARGFTTEVARWPIADVVAATNRGGDGFQVDWRQLHRALLRWQAAGGAHLEHDGIPLDLVTLARAAEPTGVPARAELVVFDPSLAHGLIQRLGRPSRQDPPPPPEPPIGSQP